MKNYLFLNKDYFDITIYQYGYEQCEPYHPFGPGMRDHYLIHCILSGSGTYKTKYRNQDLTYELHAGQAFLIEPNHLVHYYADGKEPWEYMWIEFDGMKIKEYLHQAGLSQSNPIYEPISQEGATKAFSYLRDIVEQPDLLSAEVMGNTYLFFASLIRSSKAARKIPKNDLLDFYIQSTVDFIENNYMNEITVEDMALHLNLNRSYFSKIFKSSTHKSPQEFLIQYRINKACELLRNTHTSITQIAHLIGYNNPFHFTRAFKNIMGIAPMEWRKRNQI